MKLAVDECWRSTIILLFSFQVDHFSFANQDSFIQRYLINDEYWERNGGPIFFYAGNEGDITLFADNTVSEIVQKFCLNILYGYKAFPRKLLQIDWSGKMYMNTVGSHSGSR